jgi:hypothetical protein
MADKRNLVELVDAISQEIQRKQSELKALETTIYAKQLIDAELTERLKQLQQQVETAEAYDLEFRVRVRDTLEILDGISNAFDRIGNAHAKVQAL